MVNKSQNPEEPETIPLILIIKAANRCLIIDMVIPSDYNIQKKATEKMSRYVDL